MDIVDRIFIKLAGIKSRMGSNSSHIRLLTSQLPAIEHWKNVVDKIASLVFIEYSSNLQVWRTGIKSRMSLNSGQKCFLIDL